MRKTVCGGCHKSEPSDKSPPTIIPVTVSVAGMNKPRSWESTPTYTEDLCADCQQELLSKFFGVRARGVELLPPVAVRG